MQANVIPQLTSNTPAAPRLASSSLGDTAAALGSEEFALQLQQLGQLLQAGSTEQQLPEDLQALLGRMAEGESEVLPGDTGESGTTDINSVATTAPVVQAQAADGIPLPETGIARPVSTGTELPPGGQPLPVATQVPVVAHAAVAAETDGEAVSQRPVVNVALPAGQPNVAETQPQLQPQTRLGATATDRAHFELSQSADNVRPQIEMTAPSGKFAAALTGAGHTATILEQPTGFNINSVATTAMGLGTTAVTSSGPTVAETGVQRPVISMNTPLGEQGWASEVGSRLRVMVERGNQTAEIRLNPPELGSMEVKVVNDGERTSVTFFAQSSATRDALEAAMPRLREMFGEGGLQLADANVSQQQTMAGEREQTLADNSGGVLGGDSEEVSNQAAVPRISSSLVDYYI